MPVLFVAIGLLLLLTKVYIGLVRFVPVIVALKVEHVVFEITAEAATEGTGCEGVKQRLIVVS